MEAATQQSSIMARSEFRNQSGGQIGVIIIDNGKEKAISVKPDESILLTQQEQILTANAPKLEKNNPFTNGSLVLIRPASQIANRRPIGDPSLMPGQEVDPEAVEAARIEREAKANEAKEREAKRTAEAQAQGEQGAQPRVSRPPAKSEGEGGVEAPKPPEETANKPQASATEGKRDADEETAA
jgi:hypothetical protein